MATLEDVFHIYERNANYYHNCGLRNEIDNCPMKIGNDCFCATYQTVIPETIGYEDMDCNINRKCYIKPDEECPICFEKIMRKSDAFITNCGHTFHKKCLNKYIHIKWLSSKWTSVARCPMCRCSLGYPRFYIRYRSNYEDMSNGHDNELDKLEDFWLSIDYKIPYFCCNGYNHYLGMNKDCYYCKSYRETGDICP